MENPNCDGQGSGACTPGEVRVLPIGAGGNLILCRLHFRKEAAYQSVRGPKEEWGPVALWKDAKVYTGE